jgi:hypothetical protein
VGLEEKEPLVSLAQTLGEIIEFATHSETHFFYLPNKIQTMKTHLVISLILSSSMLLAQNVTTSLDQLNELGTGYSFSLTNSNLKVTLLEGDGFKDKGDYFIVQLNSILSGYLVLSLDMSGVDESNDGFLYNWTCEDNASCFYEYYHKSNKGYSSNFGSLNLGMDCEKAKQAAYLINALMRPYL